MKSMYLVMVLCVSLVNAEDSGTGSEPTGTQPPSSNDSASAGVPLDIRHRPHESHEIFIHGGSNEIHGHGGSHEIHGHGGSHGIHGHVCARTAACVSAGGKCQTAACTALQQKVKGGCTIGGGCQCCAPRVCDPKPRCKQAGGFCAQTCGRGLTVIAGGCTGTPCSCCAKTCPTTHECEHWGGVCQRGGCGAGQREFIGVCVNQGCTCCRNFIRDAEGNNTAGEVNEVENTNEQTVVKQEEGNGEENDEEGEDNEEGDEVEPVVTVKIEEANKGEP